MEYNWRGPLPRVSEAMRLPPRQPWPEKAFSNPHESGRGILLIADNNGVLSGACLAQQGWLLPQGILAGAKLRKTGDANRERRLGQQEWSFLLDECGAVKSSDRSTDARATGTLQQQSNANTTPAMDFLNIAVLDLRLTREGSGHL